MLRIIANWNEDTLYYGFPISDPRLFIRGVLEAVEAPSSVVVDFTDLVCNGYYEGTEKLSDEAKASVRMEFVSTTRIIVLTEGSTDAEFLEKSLKVLYPELAPLYSFTDFSVPRMEGGAAKLVRILKGFIGSGVANRVIAIFDNDTAATEALRSLQDLSLPQNIRVMRYPDLEYAKRYPTIGPQGIAELDVNGLAGSLEIYFGMDVLRSSNQELVPVQWKGFNQSLNQYQGELIDKRYLQDAFRKKLENARVQLIETSDWSGMKLILESLFSAFSC